MPGRSKRRKTSLSPKTLLIIVIIVVLTIVAVVQLKSEMTNLWPGRETIKLAMEQLKVKQEEYQRELNVAHDLDVDLNSLRQYGNGFWYAKRDGDVETQAQRVIEDAAGAVGLSLTSVGRVQSAKICDGINSMEINISAKAPIGEIGAFVDRVYHVNPRLHWHRMTLRPDNLRDPKNVVLNGNLRFIAVTDGEIANMLTEKK